MDKHALHLKPIFVLISATVNGLTTLGFPITFCIQPFLTIFSISDDTNLTLSIADLLFLISTELGVVNNGKYSKNQYHSIHTCLLQSNPIDPDYFSVSLPAIYLSLSPFRSTDYFLNMQIQIYLSFHSSSLCNLFSSVLTCDIGSTVRISIHPLDH